MLMSMTPRASVAAAALLALSCFPSFSRAQNAGADVVRSGEKVMVASDATANAVDPSTQLWYGKPAAKWEEALPVGSGRLGAMVFGGTATERIQFNEDTLWTGKPQDYARDGAHDHLKEIQQLIFDGKQEEASNLFRATMISKPVRQKAYQPFGDLRLTFPNGDTPANYKRHLDVNTAIATTRYTVDDVTYTREVFASYPDNAIVVRIAADQPGKVNFALKMDSPHKASQAAADGNNTLVLTGQVHDKQETVVSQPDGKLGRVKTPDVPNEEGMKFESRVRVTADGGKVSADGASLKVENANSATMVLVAATNFVNWRDVSGNPAERVAAYLKKLDGKTFESLRETHLADFQPLMARVKLDLGQGDSAVAGKQTDERVSAVRKAGNPAAATGKNPPMPEKILGGLDADPQLATLFFNYGRYMLITSSRPGTQAANLQGVWNELLDPPWESKYTTNINAEMNYWPAEVTNIPETHLPFFDLVDDMRVSGAVTAKKQYGAGGWVLHHNTDVWRGSAPINNIDGMWTTGGAWLSHHLWEHFQFNGDKEFLQKRAYPAMKEASQFFLDFLIKDPRSGYLVTNPSHSPEQGELNAGPAMDMQLIRALFDYTIESAQILGNIDPEFIAKVKDTRGKLVPDQIGTWGQLEEWQTHPNIPVPKWQAELNVPTNNHRHMSPLWGLYPGSQFTPASDKKLFDAAKVLLKARGDGSTGWSFVWRIPLWARVHDGNQAYRQMQLQMGRRVLPNLFDLCGPYQADGNYGVVGGVAEMLLQSHQRVGQPPLQHYLVEMLPAMPDVWKKSGSVSGLKARGGFEVSISWKDGALESATVKSLLGNPVDISTGGKRISLASTEAGKTYAFDGTLQSK